MSAHVQNSKRLGTRSGGVAVKKALMYEEDDSGVQTMPTGQGLSREMDEPEHNRLC